jgi:hypothetical protein
VNKRVHSLYGFIRRKRQPDNNSHWEKNGGKMCQFLDTKNQTRYYTLLTPVQHTHCTLRLSMILLNSNLTICHSKDMSTASDSSTFDLRVGGTAGGFFLRISRSIWCMREQCTRRSSFWLYALPHMSHTKGRCPLCVCACVFKCAGCMNPRPHSAH